MSVAAIAIVILFIALLLVESLSAGAIESLLSQRPKISPSCASGCIELLNVIAERGRSARFFNLYWRAARKHVAGIFPFAGISLFSVCNNSGREQLINCDCLGLPATVAALEFSRRVMVFFCQSRQRPCELSPAFQSRDHRA
jgi:hypothetical protein